MQTLQLEAAELHKNYSLHLRRKGSLPNLTRDFSKDYLDTCLTINKIGTAITKLESNRCDIIYPTASAAQPRTSHALNFHHFLLTLLCSRKPFSELSTQLLKRQHTLLTAVEEPTSVLTS